MNFHNISILINFHIISLVDGFALRLKTRMAYLSAFFFFLLLRKISMI